MSNPTSCGAVQGRIEGLRAGGYEMGQDVEVRGDDGLTSPDDAETIVIGRVKWFDPVRGYGFMVPADGIGSDILLHFSVVNEAGRRMLPEGTSVTCAVVARERGRQARRIIAFDLGTAIGPDPETAAARAADRTDPRAMIAAAGPLQAQEPRRAPPRDRAIRQREAALPQPRLRAAWRRRVRAG